MENNKVPVITGWLCKFEGNRLVLFSKEAPDTCGYSGIRIDVNKGARTLDISGWYDSCVGIEGATLSLDQILTLFNQQPKEEQSMDTIRAVCALADEIREFREMLKPVLILIGDLLVDYAKTEIENQLKVNKDLI